MPATRTLRLSPKALLAVLLAVVCVLFLIEWAQIVLRRQGVDDNHAFYVARIGLLPLLYAAVWLIVRDQRTFFARAYACRHLTLRAVIAALAIGVLARTFWWCQVTARAAFGVLPSSSAAPPRPLQLAYACPDWPLLLLAGVVLFALVPVVEEFVHRGVVQSSLADRGPWIAIFASSLFFAAMHKPDSYAWAFAFGVVFGVMFWHAGNLWPPIVTHATYDGLKLFDWICLRIVWNPSPVDIPLMPVGIASAAIGVICVVAIIYLVSPGRIGPPRGGPTARSSKRVGHTFDDV